MKKKIIKALFVLFLLFVIGGGASIFTLRRINNDLRNLISLHKVEIIRQDLVINVQNVQGNLFTVGTGLGRELDEIVQNVTSLDAAVNRCSGCHHNEDIARRIREVQQLTEEFKDALSGFITTTANKTRLDRVKRTAAGIGDRILERTQEMTILANQRLQQKTEEAIGKVVKIQDLMIAMLICALALAVLVAVFLTRQITGPINRLVRATKEISKGNLGYTTDFEDNTEFNDFARMFNEMSLSLKASHDRITSSMKRLSVMSKGTVSLYSSSDIGNLLYETMENIKGIVKAEAAGIMVFDKDGRLQALSNPSGMTVPPSIDRVKMNEWYNRSNQRAVIINDPSPGDEVPLGGPGDPAGLRNVMVVWLKYHDELRGAIRLVNKMDGNFQPEDLKLFSILANNFTVAHDNILLYTDLRKKMQELRETQQQLVQAAKLAAIGELASNVAHEINNPLTSILGYAELIKEEIDRDVVLKDIAIIEQESLRAREIVRQLLEFSRKKPLELRETDVNGLVQDVFKLMAIPLKATEIQVFECYGDLPPVMADADQLKQVFLNIINNAVAAMGKRGTLTVTTGARDDEIFVRIADTGVGIDDEALPRIFEPFFTTKEEKGTGLGLSISYK
ncbi:MAG: ATP-binding protein, partial [bacterium]